MIVLFSCPPKDLKSNQHIWNPNVYHFFNTSSSTREMARTKIILSVALINEVTQACDQLMLGSLKLISAMGHLFSRTSWKHVTMIKNSASMRMNRENTQNY